VHFQQYRWAKVFGGFLHALQYKKFRTIDIYASGKFCAGFLQKFAYLIIMEACVPFFQDGESANFVVLFLTR